MTNIRVHAPVAVPLRDTRGRSCQIVASRARFGVRKRSLCLCWCISFVANVGTED